MKQYIDLLNHVARSGREKADRTGTGTLSVFGYQMRFDLAEGFPLVTTKKLHLPSIVHELLWFLSGSTNVKYLQDNGVTIWDEWADSQGHLGPVYGKQWRDFHGSIIYNGVDQISLAVELLRTDPDSRRIVVSAWNPFDQPAMALAPCHCLFQFYTEEMTLVERLAAWGIGDEHRIGIATYTQGLEKLHQAMDAQDVPRRRLSCQLYQRSCDAFLGLPFNIASYALLTHMMAQQVGMAVGDFVWTGGDVHLYSNHLEQAELQVDRAPKALPELVIHRKPDSIFDYRFEDFAFEGYDPHPAIKAKVAV